MADNITITPGTGKTVAFKDIGGVDYQRIILVNPASGNDLPADDSNGLDVIVTNTVGVTGSVSTSGSTVICTGTVDVGTITNPVSINGTVDVTANSGITIIPSPSLAGWSPVVNTAIDNTVTELHHHGGKLGGWSIYNPDPTDDAFVQLFNIFSTGDVTLGTTVPNFIISVPHSQTTNIEMTIGILFDTGILYAATTTPTGSTTPTTPLIGAFLQV